MRIYREKDYDAMSRRAANIISAEVIRRPDCVLGLATGSTPIGTYKQLAAWNQRGDFSFKEVHSVNLDEYKDFPETTTRATAISCRKICLTILISSRRIHMCPAAWQRIRRRSAEGMMSW